MSATREVWGAEVSLLTLAAALRARGVAVAVVCLPGELAEQARSAGHDVFVADPGSTKGRVLVAGYLWREYARHIHPGDRLVMFSYILTAWAPLYRRRLTAQGVRVALDLHDQLESNKAFWSVRVACEAVDTVIACSAFTASQMGARDGVFALHRPVTTDLADSGIAVPPERDSAATPASLSDRHGVRPDEADLSATAEATTTAAAAAGRRRAERVARAGVADEGGRVVHRDHGGGSRTRRGRGGSRGSAGGSRPVGAAAAEPFSAGHGENRAVPFRVGIVGRISREKRHEVLIEAVGLIDRPVEMIVRGSAFGEGHEYAAEIDAAGARVLGARYVNEGRVPATEALSDLDVVVVGNPAEPMGRTVLEAKLRGVVAVVPDTGGSSELVEDGRTGLVYRADDPSDLAHTLLRLIDDPDLVARIARDAVDTVPRPAEYAAAYLSRLG